METAAWELNALEARLGTDILIAIIVGRSIFVSAISYYDASAHPDNITIFKRLLRATTPAKFYFQVPTFAP